MTIDRLLAAGMLLILLLLTPLVVLMVLDARQPHEARSAASILVSDSWDADRPRAAAAVALAEAVVAPAPPAPAPPNPPSGCACGGRCSGGVYRPDGRISMDCDADCKCGCQRKSAAVRCERCLGTGFVMGGDGVVRPCRSCPAPGSAPAR